MKKIIFHGEILKEGLFGRGSGIYYVSINLLEQFLKKNQFELYVYAPPYYRSALKSFLEKKFSMEVNFYPPISYKDKIIDNLLVKRQNHKVKRNVLRKILYGILKDILIFGLPNGKYQKVAFDASFSPFHVFDPDVIAAEKRFMFLHDAIPYILGAYSKNVEKWFEDTINSLNEKDFYFANSLCTKKDFLKIFPFLSEEQFLVTPLAVGKFFRKITDENCIAEVRKKYHIPENKKYVFSLCTLEPRKNLLRAVRTFVEFVQKNKIEDMVFVLGGGAWKDFIAQFEKELGTLPENLIYRAGYVAEEDLPALYSGAEWFVYTSQYEGFGLPPLEAMQCGCPVITSNNSSLPEVVGDAGIMIDFDSDGQHIKAYETYYFDKKYRQEMAEKGLERSKLFSWEKTAELILTKMLG